MDLLLKILWFIWEAKYVLFWLYLWQLKEYHAGRFLDHFNTHKGKKLIFNYSQILKLALLLFLFFAGNFSSFLLTVLAIVYTVQAAIFAKALLDKTVKKPVITSKTLFLIGVSFAVVIAVLLFGSAKIYILFDLLTPLAVSVVVLPFQPFFVALRNNILKKAAAKMAQTKNVSGLKVIAITGSYGKTSTKEFLTTILSEKFKVLSTKEHQNSEIGVANCILNDLKPSHQIFIAEVGAYNKGKVKQVCQMLGPKIGIVTGVNEQHLALFGSLENLLSAEGGGELAAILPENGLLVVNGDNKYCLDLYKKSHLPKKAYSISRAKINSDIWADEILAKEDFVSFLALTHDKQMAHFRVNVLGRQNVQNLLGAILVAKELGMDLGQIAEACKKIMPQQAGMVLKPNDKGFKVIDSSYSANPDGVAADLNFLSVFAQKKVIVMPCLIELGKNSGQIHERLGREIGKICDLAIITTKDYFKEVKKGATEAGMEERDILLCDKPSDIYSIINLRCKSGDAILLEGRVPNGIF